jgi:hypothetical protein
MQLTAKQRAREAAENDIISQLSPAVVCEIIHGVFNELVKDFEVRRSHFLTIY